MQADAALGALQVALVTRAGEHADSIMPGFTHLQTAQPVTLGHHLMAYYEMAARDRSRFADARARLNQCPLGSAALAGTGFPIDREMTAQALGFAMPTANSLDAVSDRDFALDYLMAAAQCALHLSRLAEEFIIWASQPFGFVALPDALSTGSSIMPQKKNPDAAELVRGHAGRIVGCLTALMMTMKGLPLAYSKDMQDDKPPVFEAASLLTLSLAAMTGMVEGATFRTDRMRAGRRTRLCHRHRPGRLAGARGEHSVPRGAPHHRQRGQARRRAAASPLDAAAARRPAGDRCADRRAGVRGVVGGSIGRRARQPWRNRAGRGKQAHRRSARRRSDWSDPMRLAAALLLIAAVSACGVRADLKPQPGKALPVAPLGRGEPPTSTQLLEIPPAGGARTQRRTAQTFGGTQGRSLRPAPQGIRRKAYGPFQSQGRRAPRRGRAAERASPMRWARRSTSIRAPRSSGTPGCSREALAALDDPCDRLLRSSPTPTSPWSGCCSARASAPTWSRAARCGARWPPASPRDDIVFSGVGKTARELADGACGRHRPVQHRMRGRRLRAGARSPAAMGARADAALRVNPDVDAGTHEKISTGKAENKFGVPIDRAGEIFARLAALPGLNMRGLAVHIGSQLSSLDPLEAAFTKLGGADRRLARSGPHDHPCRSRRRDRRALQGGRSHAEPGGLRRDGRAGHARLGRAADVRAGPGDHRAMPACC